MKRSLACVLACLLVAMSIFSTHASAGCFGFRERRQFATGHYYQYYSYNYQAPVYQVPTTPLPTPQAPAKASPQTSVPPEVQSFLGQLNAMRAQRGLSMVRYDAYCYNDASINNRFQLAHGIGHFFMGRARRQNAAIGQSSSYQVLIQWANSPGHADALFDPTIQFAAVAHDGHAWTFSAR